MKNIIKIFSGIVLLSIFCFFVWFMSNDVFSCDDMWKWETNFLALRYSNPDGFFTDILTVLFGKTLPIIFHINPHTFSMTAGAWVRAFNVTFLCYLMSLFMFIGRGKTKVFPVVLALSALYFCYANSNVEFRWANLHAIPSYDLTGTFMLLTEYASHFGQLLTFIFGLGFIYYIVKYFVKDQMPKENRTVILTVFAFLTAFSSLFVNTLCGVFFLAVIIYLLSVNKDKSDLIKNNKVIAFPFISYLAGTVIFYIYSAVKIVPLLPLKFFGEIKTICRQLLVANSFETALVIMLSAILYFLALNKSTYIKRMVFVVCSVAAGIFAYVCLFVASGESSATMMTELPVLTRLLLMSLVFMLFGGCMREHTSEPKEQKVLSVLFTLVLIAFSAVQIPFIYATMKIWRTMSEESKVTTYCVEKMYRFYSLRNKTALLPDDALYKILQISNFTNDADNDWQEQITNRIFFKNTNFTKYYKTFYKEPNIVAYKFIDAKKALKIFFEEGGMIDAKELKTLNFQNLYDDKFVLNRALEKSKFDTI